MHFEAFQALFGDQAYFDMAMAAQLAGLPRHGLRVQLHRWTKAGKLLPLRRGVYAFADPMRRRAINPAALANFLYKPSYLSTFWALGYYGLIPERVAVFTSVCTRAPREFQNDFGSFVYSKIKRNGFFGFKPVRMDRDKVLLAEPEKALLDLWHLNKGEWDRPRMSGMRFQQVEIVSETRLEDYARRFQSPRLMRAVAHWKLLSESESHDDAGVEL